MPWNDLLSCYLSQATAGSRLGIPLPSGQQEFNIGMWHYTRALARAAQMQAAVEGRAAPVSVAAADARFKAEPSLDYVLVAGEGEYAGPTRWLYAIVDGRPGWHAVNAVALQGGGQLLLDRGALPDEMRGQLPEPSGAVSFRGFARRPELKPSPFTPASQPEKGVFFWRDSGVWSPRIEE